MTPIWAWARRELLRQRRATLALVLLIGVSGAVVLTTAAGARRTGSAFERSAEVSHTADAQFQYRSDTVEVDDVSDALLADPRVEQAVPVYLTFGSVEGSDYELPVFNGPSEDLFTTIDIPRVVEGRLPDPSNPHEALANEFVMHDLDAKVGDTITMRTFAPDQISEEGEADAAPAGPEIPLKITGVSRTTYDLADPEFPAFYATPAFSREYAGKAFAQGPTLEVATRPGANAGEIIEGVVPHFDVDDVFVAERSERTARVADGYRVLAVGLWAFAAVAGIAALVAGAQALHRRMAEAADDLPALRAMGLSRAECTVAVVASALPAVVLGVALAVAGAIVGSLAMPIGSARLAEPSPGLDIDALALGLGALLLFALLTAAATFGGMRTVRIGLGGAVATRTRRPAAALLASGRFSPSSELGVTMALDPGEGRTSVPVRSAAIGVVFGVAGVVAALTFGTGLDKLVDDPAASGWNWTLAPEVDEGDLDALIAIDGVQDVGVIQYRQVQAEGDRLTGVSMRAEHGTPSFTVVAGRMPSGPREVALGPKTADELGLEIGDPVHLADPKSPDTPREAVLVGRVLLPVNDDNAFNEGVVLTPDLHEAVKQTTGFEQPVVTFADDIDQAEAARRVEDALPEAMSVYAYPTPPPDVANLEGVQSLPRVLGLFLGLLGLAAVGHALATSVRRRRHDLGIVRSMGFVASDILRTLTAQSWTLMAIGVVAGIPLGIAIGRVAWGVVADGIGVKASGSASLPALAAVALITAVAGAALSLLPGISATRQRAVDTLRVE